MAQTLTRAVAAIAFFAFAADTGLAASASTCAYHWPWSQPQTFAFPAGISLLNVKNTSLPNGGARGDGSTDDWLAIQTAFNESGTAQIIFFPAGVYMVSQPLTFPRNGAGVTSRRIIYGESVLNTCIRVFDANPVFSNASTPKAVIHLGEGVAQNFYNGIHSITVSTGAGNPGGVGVQFDANNMGSMRNVSIVSEDGDGVFGLDMQYSDQIGPLLIKWLYVSGFGTGVATATNVDSETLEHIWLTNQRTAGFSNTGQVVSIRDMTVIVTQATCVPVMQTSFEVNDAFLTLIQSNLVNSVPGVVLQTAINASSSMLHLRDVATSGFNYSIMYVGGTPPPPPPPAPTSCINTTIYNETAGNSPQIAQYAGISSDDCCIKCLEAQGGSGGNEAPGPCMAWTFVAGATNASNVCYLHNGTSTYPRPKTITGILNLTMHAAAAAAPGNGSVNVTTPYITEWVSHPIVKLWDDGTTPDASLNLTIRETPEPPLQEPSLWVGGLGVPINGSYYNCTKREVDENTTRVWEPDCSPLFQAVLNTGTAGSIYFPTIDTYPFTWYFYGNISIPRTVQRIVGTGTTMGGPAFWKVDQGDETDPPLIIERYMATYGPQVTIWHASRRTVVLKDIDGVYGADCNTPGGLGDVYIDDGVFGPINFCGGQRVWARQLNTENVVTDVNITGGATVWVLGHKTERGEGGLINVTDSTLEVLGTFAYSTDEVAKIVPLYTVTNSSASVSLKEYNANCNPFQSLAAETRDGVTHTLSNNFSVPGVIPGHSCANGTRGSGFTLLNAYSSARDVSEGR